MTTNAQVIAKSHKLCIWPQWVRKISTIHYWLGFFSSFDDIAWFDLKGCYLPSWLEKKITKQLCSTLWSWFLHRVHLFLLAGPGGCDIFLLLWQRKCHKLCSLSLITCSSEINPSLVLKQHMFYCCIHLSIAKFFLSELECIKMSVCNLIWPVHQSGHKLIGELYSSLLLLDVILYIHLVH